MFKLLNDKRGINNKSAIASKLRDSNGTDLQAKKAGKANMKFANIGNEIQKSVKNGEIKKMPLKVSLFFRRLSDPINAIDNKNSSGDDFIRNMLVETFGLTPVLAALFNQ